jgi:acetylglutamate/LysW-gamma-L-alpha-aminoadipate kinase
MLVIKIGGGAAIGSAAFANFAADIATIAEPVVVVHGGNAEFSALSERLGMPPQVVTSSTGRVSRYVDEPTMDAMLMAYCGKVDVGIATGRRKPVIRGEIDGKTRVFRDDHAGTIEHIDTTLIETLMNAGFVILVSPPALSHDGVPINVDGDKLAQKLAEHLKADGLLFFSDTPGLLADRYDESTLITSIDANQPANALAAAQGRMVVKVEQAIKAVERGVGQVVFADARVGKPVTRALNGSGTVISEETAKA